MCGTSRTSRRAARPGTTRGVYARIAQRLLAMATCNWHNWATGAPVKRSLTAHDH